MTTWFWSEDVRVLKRMIAVAALALPMLAGAEEIGQVSTVFKFLGPNDRIVVEAFDDPKVEGAVSYTHLTLPTNREV